MKDLNAQSFVRMAEKRLKAAEVLINEYGEEI